jgi:hypothetical protein
MTTPKIKAKGISKLIEGYPSISRLALIKAINGSRTENQRCTEHSAFAEVGDGTIG